MDKYFLYYAGFNKESGEEQIGVLTSNNLSDWQRYSKVPNIPLSSAGSFDKDQTSNPCVLKHEGLYKMWYQGKSKEGILSILYAESKDGISWSIDKNPVLSLPTNTKPEYRLGYQHPHVIFDEQSNKFKMWLVFFQNNGSKFFYGESVDGKEWELEDKPIMTPEYDWEGERIYYPCVMFDSGKYKMWYTGYSRKARWSTGYAESKDGIKWEKSSKPIISFFVFPKIIRRAFEFFSKIIGMDFRIALSGIGSPFVWKENSEYLMIAHEIGTHGRLYIPLYKSLDGKNWQKERRDILEGTSFEKWDYFFQGDPYLYVNK